MNYRVIIKDDKGLTHKPRQKVSEDYRDKYLERMTELHPDWVIEFEEVE